MPETIIDSVITGKLPLETVLKWLNSEDDEDTPEDCEAFCCSKSEFVTSFLSYLRLQTDSILKPKSVAQHQNTPDKIPRNQSRSEKPERTDEHKTDKNPEKDDRRKNRRVKTQLFNNSNIDTVSSDESRLSERATSTPLKSEPLSPASPVTPFSRSKEYERCDTPRNRSRNQEFCLGDYLVNASVKSKKKKNKDASDTSIEYTARRSNSQRSEKRRINPTNIDVTPQKSFSMNSFDTESFSDNSAFKQSLLAESPNSFNAERKMLKQERHKLIEKFSTLNTQTPPKLKKELEVQANFVKIDSNKVTFSSELDRLVNIYEALLNNNLVPLTSEIYFLISILLSNQYEQDLKSDLKNVLTSIHNSTYFAVKSLDKQRGILEVIADKNTLKLLGENKKIKTFSQDLAKFFLNAYGVKCEVTKDEGVKNFANGMVCFNLEMDNAENFPSTLSFQNFKKQRDMFYEILRWYNENGSHSPKTPFRARVKALLSLAVAPANHAHLSRLFMTHLLAECVNSTQQESKLSKLQRRLTLPVTQENYRLPNFSLKEMFYKEFLIFADNEGFRTHLKDCLSTEVCALNGTNINADDRNANSNKDLNRDYLQLMKKLYLLSKFLGFLTDLPYSLPPVDYTLKIGACTSSEREIKYTNFNEKVAENDLLMRNYTQPTINLKDLLIKSIENGRLTITLPWLIQYLSLLHQNSLKQDYFTTILGIIQKIYAKVLKNTKFNRTTSVFLKLVLSWFFDLPTVPQDLLFVPNQLQKLDFCVKNDNFDYNFVVTDAVVQDLCPFLKEIYNLLVFSKPFGSANDCSYRHITPLTMTLNNEDRLRNKEREIQSRLEEALIKSLPQSTRRVLEIVIEKVTCATIKQITSTILVERKKKCRHLANDIVKNGTCNEDLETLLKQMYNAEMKDLLLEAKKISENILQSRSKEALIALLPSSSYKPYLESLATKSSKEKVSKWLNENWNSSSVLCKDVNAQLRKIQFSAENEVQNDSTLNKLKIDRLLSPKEEFERLNISPATTILAFKEEICLLLENESPTDRLSVLLTDCVNVCDDRNVFYVQPAQVAIFRLTLDFCIVVVSKQPKMVTTELLESLLKIWDKCCPNRQKLKDQTESFDESLYIRDFGNDDRMPTPISEDETDFKPGSGDTKNGSVIIGDTKKRSVAIGNDRSAIIGDTKNGSVVTGDAKSGSVVIGDTKTSFKLEEIDTSKGPQRMDDSKLVMLKGDADKSLLDKSLLDKSLPDKSLLESKLEEVENLIDAFNRILCPRNILILSYSDKNESEVWEAMATLILFLLNNCLLSEDSLTEQCLAVYREEWPQKVLENVAFCMKYVSQRWNKSHSGKFHLFLDFLSEFCGNMDLDSFDFDGSY